jgi:hypothetical protein
MSTHESYKAFLQKIIDTHFPDESLVFEIEADSWIEEAEKDGEVHHVSETSEKMSAGGFEAIVPIVSIVSVVLGSYKTFYDIIKLKKELKKIDEAEMREDWVKRLRKRGLKPEKAELIADEFVKEMINFAK